MRPQNRRARLFAFLVLSVAFLAAISIMGVLMTEQAAHTDFSRKNQPPSLSHPFGTDWMGRDMFARTLCGLSMSIRIGLLTATLSALIALLLGALAAMGGKAGDAVASWLIDLTMGIPHILLLILISFALGKGFRGVVVGVVFTHWMSLARLLRGEIAQLRQSGFILVARKLGVGKARILTRHMLPHLFPQFVVGLILLFPHAVLHEASVTFLGFGLSSEQPAIGVILSESMRYLIMGRWWLAVFPGGLLVVTVLLFHTAGASLRRLTDPATIHE